MAVARAGVGVAPEPTAGVGAEAEIGTGAVVGGALGAAGRVGSWV